MSNNKLQPCNICRKLCCQMLLTCEPKQNTWAQWIAESCYKHLQDNSCVSPSVGCLKENHLRPKNTDQLGPFFHEIVPILRHTFCECGNNLPLCRLPTTNGAREFNDFRQVALTVIISKCMERLVRNQQIESVANGTDHTNPREE